MEMHRALRLAGGAGGEGDEADVVGRGLDRLEARRGVGHQRLEAVRSAAAPVDDAREAGRQRTRLLQLLRQAVIAEREPDLRLVERVGDLARPQHRHRRDDDAAGLQHREEDRDPHRRVGGAQEHAAARHEPELAGEDVGDPVHPLVELAIGQGLGRADEAGRIAPAGRDPAVEKARAGIEPRRVLQLRAREQERRPLLLRRQVVAREAVDMGAVGHRAPPSPLRATRERSSCEATG